jgi:hypothetical protein
MTFHPFQIGLDDQLSDYLRGKVILCNQLACLFAAIDVVYFSLSLLFFPALKWIYLFGGLVILTVFFFNHWHWFGASRFLTSVAGMFVGMGSYAAISQGPADILLGNVLIVFGFLIIPFILFDLREWPLLVVSFAFSGAIVLLNDQLNTWVDIKIDNSVFKSPAAHYLTHLLAVGEVFFCLYILQGINRQTEAKMLATTAEAGRKAQELEASQAALKNTLAEVEQARIAQEQQAWVSQGLAQVAGLLRGGDLAQRADRLLAELVRYIDANQGGLYTIDEENGQPEIVLTARYAYGRKKFMEQRLRPGQGLLGQAYLEKETTLFAQVPEGYLTIGSGLGEASPRHLVIVPMLANERVEGLLELASFREFAPHHIEFLEKAGQEVAAALATHRANALTRKLLAQSRLQAEELRAQEEEMRQNMEELLATQEALQRKAQEQAGLAARAS